MTFPLVFILGAKSLHRAAAPSPAPRSEDPLILSFSQQARLGVLVT
jgi:hypothetical protein